eukprot:3977739-Prymnesium_polylepis.1
MVGCSSRGPDDFQHPLETWQQDRQGRSAFACAIDAVYCSNFHRPPLVLPGNQPHAVPAPSRTVAATLAAYRCPRPRTAAAQPNVPSPPPPAEPAHPHEPDEGKGE